MRRPRASPAYRCSWSTGRSCPTPPTGRRSRRNAERDSLLGGFCSAFRAEIAAQTAIKRHLLLDARHARVVVPKGGADLVERDVGEDTAIGEILHVSPAAEIERVIDRIAGAVPLERPEAKALGQLLVEGGRGLEPAPVEPDLGVAVIAEGV